MSSAALPSVPSMPVPAPPAPATPPVPLVRRSTVVFQGKLALPPWVDDFESFQRWAYSDDFPTTGWFSYLGGVIWVDPSMEEFLTHNQVKAAYTATVGSLVRQIRTGRFVPDRMLLTNPAIGLSTEPDGLFFLWATLQSGRLR